MMPEPVDPGERPMSTHSKSPIPMLLGIIFGIMVLVSVLGTAFV
jgi:hypothetical protein